MRTIVNHNHIQGCEEFEIDSINILIIIGIIRAANAHAAVFRCCGRRIGKVAVCARCRITVMIRSRIKRGLVEIKGSTCHVSNKGIGFRIRRGTLIDADIAQIAFKIGIVPTGNADIVFVICMDLIKECPNIADLVIQIAILISGRLLFSVHIEYDARILVNSNNNIVFTTISNA